MSATQKTNDNDCPQSTVLLDYIQGRLHPPALDECEAHVADCNQCHETLRTLDPSDTLSEKVAEVISSTASHGTSVQEAADPDDESQHRIGRLIGRLTSREFVLANGGQNLSRHGMTPAESELLADRAAEVLRYVKEESTDTEGALGRLGDYRLLNLIGAGSTGVVFQAQDISLDRQVALKVLRPSLGELARQRFLAEARSAASIEHNNVVTIFQVGQVDRLAFMAMQWQPGQTLESKLRTGEKFHNEATRQIIKLIAAGLDAAHQKQVVHRDIKPANIWLCEANDEVKILDFGLARIADDDPGLTATGMLAGTPNFMSPEQSRGLELDGRSDLFSLGCVMYQLLARRLPFGAPTVLATLQSIQNDSPLIPQAIEPSITDELSDLTMGLLEKQPANRPQTAAQVVGMIETARGSWPVHVNRYEASVPVDSGAGNGSKSRPATTGTTSWSLRLTQALGLLLIGTAAWWWSPQIIRIATDQGEVVIETDDAAVEIQIFKNEKLIRVVDTKTQQAFDLRSGNYTIKATGDDSAEGTFEVTPDSLVMKRGEQQIVRVSHTPNTVDVDKSKTSEQGRAVAKATRVKRQRIYAEKEKQIYDARDKKFNISLKKAKTEYDGLRVDALETCADLMRTDQQRSQMMELIRPLARQPGMFHSETRRPKIQSNLNAILKVLRRLPAPMTLEFIEHEIEHGNYSSQTLCSFWINGSGISGRSLDTHLSQIKACTPALCRMIIGHYDNPGIMNILKSLVDHFRTSQRPEISKAIVDEIVKSEIPKSLKRKVLTGKLDFRLSAIPAIQVLLGEDREVYQKLTDDLFAKSTTPLQRENILSDFVFPWEPKTLIAERCQTVLRYLKHDREGLTRSLGKRFRAVLRRLELSGADPAPLKEVFDALDEIASSRDWAVSTIDTPTQPVFQGKTFSKWLEAAQFDRDDQTRINSIEACAATAEADQQWDRLLSLFSQIAKRRGTLFIGGHKIDDAYQDKIGHAMHQMPPTKAFGFVCNEIENGNKKSRSFCSLWINGMWLDSGTNVGLQYTLRHSKKLEKAAPKLSGLIVERLEKPGVIEILNALLHSYDWLGPNDKQIIDGVLVGDLKDSHQSIVNEVVSQGVPAALKQRVLAGTTDFRIDALPSIGALLANNTDVLAAFEKDFLNTKSTPQQRLKILNAIDLSPTSAQHKLPHTRLEERSQIVLRLLKSDITKLPVAIPSAGGPPGIRSEEMTRQWLAEILRGLQAKLKEQGSAELKADIAAALKQAQPFRETGVANSTPIQLDEVKNKPLKYDDKTFEQWFDLAAYDRSEAIYSGALKACSEIATDNERAKLVELFRELARKRVQVRERTSLEQQSSSVRALNHVLNSLPAGEAVDFVTKEIVAGNERSRQWCALWISSLRWKDGIISELHNVEQREELSSRIEYLLTVVIANLNESGVEDVMKALVLFKEPSTPSRPEKGEESPSQRQFRKAIVDGTPNFRIRYLYPAMIFLGHQQDVFQKYADDVLSNIDPKSRTEIVERILVSDEIPFDGRAKLLLQLAEDVLKGDSREMRFENLVDLHGGRGSRALSPEENEMQIFLFPIYQTAKEISKETKEQLLIPRLRAMVAKQRLKTNKQVDSEAKTSNKPLRPKNRTLPPQDRPVKISDLEFLTEHLQGNAAAEMPSKSIFEDQYMQRGGIF